MISVKLVVFTILGLNFFGVLFSCVHLLTDQKRSAAEVPEVPRELKTMRAFETGDEENSPYRFDDPLKAYFLLEKLDIFEEIPDDMISKANYSDYASGLKIHNNYCEKHRAYFVENPSFLFEKTNVITNFYRKHKLRTQVLPEIGANDLHPKVFTNGGKPIKAFRDNQRLDATLFIMQNLFFYRRQIGKQFSCLSQASNHIPGHDSMYRKDNVGQRSVDYANKYRSKPTCFSFDKYFIKTWILSKEDQCKDFFEEFLSPKYQTLKKERDIVYFRKIGANVHEGKGVFPVNDDEETYIQKLYGNGTLCGKISKNNLIQYNVHNLLLVNNRKFGFRMFLLIASTNPLLVYYHDGYARLSLNEYDSKSKEINTFVTNIGVNLKEAEKENGMTEEEIQESTLWFLEDFQKYMIENGLTTDPNWLDNYLRPELKKVMIHLIRMSQTGFIKRSSVYELYGLDFVMDEDFKLWFIEANTMPLVDGFTPRSTKMLNKMLIDSIEIEMGLVRSRMKRVINYINMLSEEISVDPFISNLGSKRKEFRELTKNYFEPEFVPSAGNRFQKIVDERKQGTERYSNLIRKECL